MSKLSFALAFAAAVSAAAATSADAQGRGRNSTDNIPPGQMPPAGKCRIWIDGVPPGRQGPITDCATAERNRPANGRVIYGSERNGSYDDRNDRDRDRDRGHDRDRDGDRDRDRDRRDSDRDVRRGDMCLDRNHDGYCDNQNRQQSNVCYDRDHDGRCDAANGTTGTTYPDRTRPPSRTYPTTLPTMLRTDALRDGQISSEAATWLGTYARTAQAHYLDFDRDKNPEKISWVDSANRTLLVWVDRNDDGRADRVEAYENGRLVQTIGR